MPSTPRIFLINLDRAPDRLRFMKAQLDRLPYPWERVQALDGRIFGSPPWEGVDHRAYERNHGKPVNPNRAGCYLSHYKAFRRFLETDAEFGVFFQDDVQLVDELPEIITALLARHDEWDMVKLCGRGRGILMPRAKLTERYALATLLGPQRGAGAFLVNRFAAERYVARLLPMRVPFDHTFENAWEFGIRLRVVAPPPLKQEMAGPSTIVEGNADRNFVWYRRGGALVYRARIGLRRLFHTLAEGGMLLGGIE